MFAFCMTQSDLHKSAIEKTRRRSGVAAHSVNEQLAFFLN